MFDLAALRAALVRQRMKQAQGLLLPMPRGAGMGPVGPITAGPRGGGYHMPFNGNPEPDFPGPQATPMGAMTDLDRRPPMPKPKRRTIGGGDFSPLQNMLESYYAAGAPAPTRHGSDMIQGSDSYALPVVDPELQLPDDDLLATLRQRLLSMRRR